MAGSSADQDLTPGPEVTKLLDVSRSVAGAATGMVPTQPLWRALSHVRQSWGSDGPYRALSLDELAEATAVSAAHLSRTFRAEYGAAPATALERLRLARAAFLLRHRTDSLAAVGRWCGFADQYHFSRRFSTICGMPPGSYRRDPDSAQFRDPLHEPGLVALASEILPTALVEQLDDTPAPPPLQAGQCFAQTFTVPPAMVVNRVCLYLATWFSSDSAATVRLLRLDSGGEAPVVTRRLSAMVDHAAEWIAFPAQGAGRYRLELAEPVGTPTWKWHQGDDVTPVGGSAEIDGVVIGNTNFLFSATISG